MSGCGYLDGNDTAEAVSFIIACSKSRVQPTFFTIVNKEIEDVFIYTTKTIDPAEERVTHKEVSRITRAPPRDIGRLDAEEFDLLVIPGGNGNTRILTNFEQQQWKIKGNNVEIDEKVRNAICSFYDAKKPIAVSSNGVVLLAKALEGKSLNISIGRSSEKPIVEALENLLKDTKVVEISDATIAHVDNENCIVSTAGFGANVNVSFSEIYTGATESIKAALGLLTK